MFSPAEVVHIRLWVRLGPKITHKIARSRENFNQWIMVRGSVARFAGFGLFGDGYPVLKRGAIIFHPLRGLWIFWGTVTPVLKRGAIIFHPLRGLLDLLGDGYPVLRRGAIIFRPLTRALDLFGDGYPVLKRGAIVFRPLRGLLIF